MNYRATNLPDPAPWERFDPAQGEALPAMDVMDVIDPSFECMAVADTSNEEQSEEGPGLLRPLLLSALVHGLALVALVALNFQARSPVSHPESVAIQLRIRSPAPQVESPTVEAAVQPPVLEPTRPSQPAAPLSDPVVDVPSVDSSPAPMPPTTPQLNPERPTLRILTPESLRETINGIAERQVTNDVRTDCTVSQEQSLLIDCGEEQDTRNFSILERNATYEFFTRRETPTTRTQRTIGYMASRADDIEEQLRASDISGPVVDRFLRELRSTAVDASRTGNVPLESLRDQMYSNDSTYQQQQRAFNPR